MPRLYLVSAATLSLLLVGVVALGLLARRAPAPPAADAHLSPLLLVGVDGATFDRILPLASEGRLPHLSRLMEQGAWGALETLEPTVSPAIWTTVATGRLPRDHGIFGFAGVPGQDMTTLPTSQMRRVRAFWNMLSEHRRTVGVIGWWATWPAEAVEGYVVSDRVTYSRMEAAIGSDGPRPHEVWPPELTEVVRGLVRRPDEITASEIRRFLSLTDEESEELIRGAQYRHGQFGPEFKYVHQSDRSTADIALHLLRERPTDVTAVAFYGIDIVSHLTWHFMAPEQFPGLQVDERDISRFGKLIDNYYVFIDELLGELLEAVPADTTVIVFSDHGFGPTGRWSEELPWSGGHGRITPGAPVAPDGVLIMAGPPIRPGVRLDRPHVLDLAPTVLYLQGLPLAADMPGGVFGESIREEFAAAVPLRQIPTYETTPLRPAGEPLLADPQGDAAMRERLCALGYVDCE